MRRCLSHCLIIFLMCCASTSVSFAVQFSWMTQNGLITLRHNESTLETSLEGNFIDILKLLQECIEVGGSLNETMSNVQSEIPNIINIGKDLNSTYAPTAHYFNSILESPFVFVGKCAAVATGIAIGGCLLYKYIFSFDPDKNILCRMYRLGKEKFGKVGVRDYEEHV